MHRPITPRIAATLLLSCAVMACGGDNDPTAPPEVTPVATTLHLTGGPVTLNVPQTTTVTAEVRDQMGQAMPSLAPTWISRDTTTARVTSDGTVTAVETGDTWLLAAAGGLLDSLVVRVRFPIGEGETRMRTRGSHPERTHLMDVYGRSYDMVGSDTLDRVILEFDGSNAFLLLIVPPAPENGETGLHAWSWEDLVSGATYFEVPTPGVLLSESDGDEILVFVGESGYLEVTGGTPPTASGETGTLRGHLHVRAVGYDWNDIVGDNPNLQPTGDTVTCDMDFDVSYDHHEMGYAVGKFEGGPLAGEEMMWGASVDWPRVEPPDAPLIDLVLDGSATLSALIDSPRVGALTVVPQDPDDNFVAGAGGTTLKASGYYPYFIGSGQGGTLTLSVVSWPDSTSSAELSGTIDASMLYWLQADPQNTQTGAVSMEFHALWPPRSGSQMAAEAADGRSPWEPVLSRIKR